MERFNVECIVLGTFCFSLAPDRLLLIYQQNDVLCCIAQLFCIFTSIDHLIFKGSDIPDEKTYYHKTTLFSLVSAIVSGVLVVFMLYCYLVLAGDLLQVKSIHQQPVIINNVIM